MKDTSISEDIIYIGADDKHDLYMLYNEIGNKISVNENIDSEYISDMLNMLTNTGDDKVRIESFDLYKKRINEVLDIVEKKKR